MTDTYLVNSTDLRSLAWRISVAEGLYDAPALRGDDVVVPGKHGSLDLHGFEGSPRRRYEPGSIRFSMWVLGVDPITGAGPADAEDTSVFLARLDELQALFNTRQLIIDHQVTYGAVPRTDTTRRAVARLAAPIQVVREPSSPLFGRFVADCVIPDAFWADTSSTTVSSGSVTTGSTVALTSLACTAPIVDPIITFGPSTNPKLAVGGTYVQYNGVISSGRQVRIVTADWEVDEGSGTAWTPARTDIEYGPGPSWFELDTLVSPLQATFTHTGGGSATASIAATRRWLTS